MKTWTAPRCQQGFSTTEWTLATFALIVALFTPIPALGKSAMALLGESLRNYYEHVGLLLSLP